MKTIFSYISMSLMFIFQNVTYSQTNYSLNFNNPNFYITCGTVNGGQWTVNYQDADCYLYTPILNPVGTDSVIINYKFRVNQPGQNTEKDTLLLEYYNAQNGWTIIHTVLGNQYNSVHFDIKDSLKVCASEFIVFRLYAIVTVSQSFWGVKKDNTSFTVGNVTPTNNFLPVSLISFSGFSENSHADLQWATYSETNNNFFTIERSENNSYFYPAGFVQGAGNSNTPIEYQFTDPEKLNSYVTYYRLRQTDFDGTTEVFNTIVVKKNIDHGQHIWCYVDNSVVLINYETTQDEEIYLTIFDTNGRCIDPLKFLANKGLNTFSWTPPMKNTLIGLYFFSITDSFSNVHNVKVML